MLLVDGDAGQRDGVVTAVREQAVSAVQSKAALKQLIWSSVLCTTVEWYDFLVYGTASALAALLACSYPRARVGARSALYGLCPTNRTT